MDHFILEPCVGNKFGDCKAVCPVDCIHGGEDDEQCYIHPDDCIDCGLCILECPADAIYIIGTVPSEWQSSVVANYEYFGMEAP